MKNITLLEAAKIYRDAIDRLLVHCRRHDPETGFFRTVSQYEVLDILTTSEICFQARDAVATAERGGQ